MASFTRVLEVPMLLASLLMLIVSASSTNATFSSTPGSYLSSYYYDLLCPGYGTAKLQQVTASIVKQYVNNDHTLAPSLLRLAFHDSFVQVSCKTEIYHVNLSGSYYDNYNLYVFMETVREQNDFTENLLGDQGCEGSILLNSTATNMAEKDSIVNAGSVRGYSVVDDIKAQLESICPQVYSCADIVQEVALAAMKAVSSCQIIQPSRLIAT